MHDFALSAARRHLRTVVLTLATMLPAQGALAAQLQEGRATVRTTGGIVSSQQWIASDVGAEVLAAGGNAVDAAIATGFALAVTHPTAGNIGGGGFMVIRFPNGEPTALDFREEAPAAAHPEMWLDENGEYSRARHHDSHLAVGVPGTVAGFDKAHRLYGAAEWGSLVEPSVVLARDGFQLSSALAGSLAGFVGRVRYPASIAAFSKNGTPYEPGETLRQPDLARSLQRIRDEGRDGFYRGETARLLVEEMRRCGSGLIGTEPNLARPGQRMLSSMTPSIVARDGELVAVIGSPGGRTIINTVLQLVLNLADFEMGYR